MIGAPGWHPVDGAQTIPRRRGPTATPTSTRHRFSASDERTMPAIEFE